MKHSTVYCIDLDARRPQVTIFEGEELEQDMTFFGVKDALELETNDRRLFRTQDEAEAFLELYNRRRQTLSNSEICLSRKFPAMLYTRRYLVLSLLGLKNNTKRHYAKNWKRGDLVNLHDQTYFLTVRMTRDVYFDERTKKYIYEFERP